MNLPERVDITEVGLRDGLQNQAHVIPTDSKIALVEGLLEAGLRRIQVASFVHPKRVPQMADAEAVCARLPRPDGVVYSGLALNLKGVERAHAAGLSHVDLSISASDTHGRRNAGMGLDEATALLSEMVGHAKRLGMQVRGGIQCAFGCAYEGKVPVARVESLARVMVRLGVSELALADSAGMAHPAQIETVVVRIRAIAGSTPLLLHLHDTRGLGLANVLSALQCGVTAFDTAFGGLGGCPFIPGASGNIATEDTVHMLDALGVTTGVSWRGVTGVSKAVERLLGVTLPGKLYHLAETKETHATDCQ